MKHLLLKHLASKALLIAALHAGFTFDAYTTNKALRAGSYEQDPIMKPFAGHASEYPTSNLWAVPLDLAILKSHSKKARLITTALAVGAVVIETKQGFDNLHAADVWQAYYKTHWRPNAR